MKHKFFLPVAKGLEEVLVQECSEILGATEGLKPQPGGVEVETTLEGGYRIALYSRIASRVMLRLAEVPAQDAKKLYAGIKSIRWSNHLTFKETIAVEFVMAKGARSPEFRNTLFGMQKVKDAICDQLKTVQGDRPNVDPKNPDIKIHVHWRAPGTATVSLDFTGESPHIRGLREEKKEAPLRETLAAGLLRMMGFGEALLKWLTLPASDPSVLCLWDLMTGSGTVVLEAGAQVLGLAPGLARARQKARLGFEKWKGHDEALWKKLLAEAEAIQFERQTVLKFKKAQLALRGFDIDGEAIEIARRNADRAGLTPFIQFEKKALKKKGDYLQLAGSLTGESIRGDRFVFANPPYGERLGREEDLFSLYSALGDVFKGDFKGFTAYVFSGNEAFYKKVGLKARKRIPVYNGPIECRLLQFPIL